MPTTVYVIGSSGWRVREPTFQPYVVASAFSTAISPGDVGHLPVRATWVQAPGTDTNRGMIGIGEVGRPVSGSWSHTIAWPALYAVPDSRAVSSRAVTMASSADSCGACR